jgi:uncharacterized protein involved in exopolysaccharide biosynthesis
MQETNSQERKDINLLDLLIVILKEKKMILGVTFSFTLITVVVAFLMAPVYRAETTILPSHQYRSDLAYQLLSEFTGGATRILGNDLGLNNPGDIYVGMIRSRTVYDRIIERFNLKEEYGTEYLDDAREELDESVTMETSGEGMIVLSVEDRDPRRAADMANAFVEELKELLQVIAVTEASKRRLFFEEQLKQSRENLVRAEETMRDFQERTGAIKIEDQTAAVIESISELRAQVAAKEVELKVMRTYATPRNPDLQRVEEELRGMREQLERLEARDGNKPDPLMPTAKMPKMGTDYIRNLRELKFHETLYELMAKQYEMARVDEARDAAVIQDGRRGGVYGAFLFPICRFLQGVHIEFEKRRRQR